MRDLDEALIRIRRHASAAVKALSTDELLLGWMARQFQLAAESACALSPELKARHPDFPWPALEGVRLFLSQDPFAVDPAPILASLGKDLPRLETLARELRGD
ncbi:MAG: DUF86 domain-containing protein [Candidatus Wallbacteria bacterium]|nr:DUF86 domain-containing protein [Candidatus Wallbacteria bacterium]